MVGMIPLVGPIPGGPELLIILLVLVLLFGANKIPKLARSTGQAMGEFRKGREDVEDELQSIQDGDMADEEPTSTTDGGNRSEDSSESETEETAN